MSGLANVMTAPLLRAARRAKQYLENRSFHPYVQEIEVEGERFLFRIADPVGQRWYAEDDWTHFRQIEYLKRMTTAGDTVLFCGAHHGMMCLPLARRLACPCNLIAVEAHPRNARILGENLRLNGLAGRVIERAVGGNSGEVEFVDTGNAALAAGRRSEGRPRFHVRMSTLDELCGELGVWPTLVVLDIEGAEVGAIEGARQLLEHRPKWQIEVHTEDIRRAFHQDPEHIWKLLSGRGYRFRLQDDDRSGEWRVAPAPEPFTRRTQLYAIPEADGR